MSDDNQNNTDTLQEGEATDFRELFNDEANEPVVEIAAPKKAVRRRTATPRSTVPLYSLAQVAKIIDFTTSFDAADERNKRAFFGAFGWAEDAEADGLRVAEGVQENPHEVEAFRLFRDLIQKIWGAGLGFKETIALVGEFSRVEDNVVAAFVVIVNSLVSDQVAYKKNTPVADILGESVDGLNAVKNNADGASIPELVEWIDSLFDIWPGAE